MSFRIFPPPSSLLPHPHPQFQAAPNPTFFLKNCKPKVQDLADRIQSLPSPQNLEIVNKDFVFPPIEFMYILKHNEPVNAKEILYQMLENGFVPNVADFNGLVNALCKCGRLKHAMEVFGVMGKFNCEPTIHTYNCVLKGLCYLGRVEEAYNMLNRIKKSKSSSLKPDMYTYSAVMNGFCKVGRSDKGMELLIEAIICGLEPNVVVYNTLFNGYFKEGRPMEGLVMLERMKEKGIVPDYICYNTLLHGLLKWGNFFNGFRVYMDMVNVGCAVDERLMNQLLRGLCRECREDERMLRYAYEVFDKMSSGGGCAVYPCAHELVIEAFCIGNEADKAFVNLREMVKGGSRLRPFTFENVIRVLCVEGMAEAALSVLVLMCTQGVIPSRMTFNVLIGALNRQRMVLAAAYVYSAALKRGKVTMNKPRGCSNKFGSGWSIQSQAPP